MNINRTGEAQAFGVKICDPDPTVREVEGVLVLDWPDESAHVCLASRELLQVFVDNENELRTLRAAQ